MSLSSLQKAMTAEVYRESLETARQKGWQSEEIQEVHATRILKGQPHFGMIQLQAQIKEKCQEEELSIYAQVCQKTVTGIQIF
ncbi:hypothetical protein ACLOJK_020422 [Asimina triloba]